MSDSKLQAVARIELHYQQLEEHLARLAEGEHETCDMLEGSSAGRLEAWRLLLPQITSTRRQLLIFAAALGRLEKVIDNHSNGDCQHE